MIVAAPPQACFDALLDYERMPDWQSAVKSCEVIERDSRGRGLEVEWEIDARLRAVSYRLAYSYEEPHWIGCRFVEGDVKNVEGEYTLEDRGDGTTLATLMLDIDPGTWVPGKLRKLLSDQVMKGSLQDLKRHVEEG